MPIPAVGPNDVLIQVRKTGICGTDLHIFKWDAWAQATIPVPLTIGHEFMGEVVEIGSEVEGFAVGDRVTAEGHLACRRCRNCRRGRMHICQHSVGIGVQRDGAFAEFISVPQKNVLRIHSAIPDELLAIMDPLGNATHTALNFPVLGEDVLVTGAGGPIGAMAIAICRFAGARRIVGLEIQPFRQQLARQMGADLVIDPRKEDLRQRMAELGIQAGFDVGLECSGSPDAFRLMVDTAYQGASIALLGILPAEATANWNEIIFKGIQLQGIYGRLMFETWYKMETMLLSGLDPSPIITHRFPADRFEEAFAVMETGDCGKVVLEWA
ncbi:MAG: L-threonine 3-dehydrogenase [Opitutales bacterium]